MKFFTVFDWITPLYIFLQNYRNRPAGVAKVWGVDGYFARKALNTKGIRNWGWDYKDEGDDEYSVYFYFPWKQQWLVKQCMERERIIFTMKKL